MTGFPAKAAQERNKSQQVGQVQLFGEEVPLQPQEAKGNND